MPYIYPIRLNDEERKKLDRLAKERGYRRPEIFRARLNELYKKEFPAYVKDRPEDDPYKDMSPEKYCTDLLGGVVDGEYCVTKNNNGLEILTPLKIVKEQKI